MLSYIYIYVNLKNNHIYINNYSYIQIYKYRIKKVEGRS